MNYKHVIYTLFSLVLSFSVGAAEFSRYLINHSVEEGLSQSLVNQTLQDSNGYIWVATEFGLNRFDGYEFEQIPGPNNSFASDGIVHLALLESGELFVSTYYNGAYLLNTKTLAANQIFSGRLAEVSDDVLSVDFVLEKNNALWFAIGQHLVEYNRQSTSYVVRYSMGNDEQAIRALTLDNDSLYMATTRGLRLYEMTSKRVVSLEHLPASVVKTRDNINVKAFLHDPSLGLLIGTVQGLYSFDLITKKPKNVIVPELNIWEIIDNGTELFIGTQRGLYTYDKNAKKINHLVKYSDVNPLITNNSIKNIYLDHSGLFWLSSQIQGVFTFDPKVRNFSSYSRLSKLKLTNSVVYDYLESSDGVYWIATENGLNRIDSVKDETQSFFVNADDKALAGQHTIFKLFPIKNNKMWMWHGNGLSLFDLKEKNIAISSLSPKVNEEFRLLYPYGVEQVADDKFTFISSKGHFLLDVTRNEIRSLDTLNANFKPEGSATFLPSLSGKDSVLLATIGGLIDYNFIENTYKVVFQIEEFHIHDYKYVSDWVKTSDGHVWLVINGLGVVELDKEYRVVRTLNKEHGLSDIRVYGIIEDEHKNLWISSQSGLFELERSTKKISHYTTKQGLVSNEVYNVARKLNNGKLAFNSAAGLITFDADNFEEKNVQEMPVSILSVEVASQKKTHLIGELRNTHLALAHDDYGIKFRFSNFNYALQKDVKYKISLTGESDVLYDDFSQNSIEFNRLNPGNYTFTVWAKSPITGEITAPASFNFTVNYNPWLSPIAYMIYIVLVISVFTTFYIRRVKQQSILQAALDDMQLEKQKAELALEASSSGIWFYNHATGESIQNRLTELGHNVSDNMQITDFFAYIHPEDSKELGPLWESFIAGKLLQWDVLYRIRNSDNKWVWYRDLGKACFTNSHVGNHVFTGTYTNVTATKSNEQQAQLYGHALQKMNEWLLILDKDLTPVASNPAFNKRFLKDGEVLSQQIINNVLSEEKLNGYISSIKALAVNKKLISEEVLTVPAGFDIPVLISISAIGEESVDNYVIVISDLSKQKEVEEELKYLANYDPLTHLANRTLIRDRIEQSINHANDTAIALLFIDLDRFKQVNDIYGHAVGDQLLKEVAQRMRKVVGDKHSVGRQSGDEFIVMLDGIVQPERVSRYADRLIESLAKPYQLENQTIHISCSIGMAFYPLDSENCDDLIQNADIAMLHAKQRGRNCYRFFTEEMNVQIRQRVLLENEFVWAIKENALTNYYQPIVDVKLQNIRGVELLLRWFNHGEMVSPAEFIPLAENIGKIVEVTELALEKALRELKDWLIDDRYLSINLSALHISQPGMVNKLLSILDEAKVSPCRLKLEITEGVLIDDTENAKRQLNKLKDAGFRLFLDDFGTGYSSLTYINQFPIDVIKIDQCFIREITTDLKSRAIVQTIANLADNINSYCVVEGVEDIEQVSIVQQLGCRYMQGYYFARPMPVLDLLSDETASEVAKKLNAAAKENAVH